MITLKLTPEQAEVVLEAVNYLMESLEFTDDDRDILDAVSNMLAEVL